MQDISEFHIREESSIDVTWRSLLQLPFSWVLRMVRLVAAGIGSVMRISSCSYRLSVDVRVVALLLHGLGMLSYLKS